MKNSVDFIAAASRGASVAAMAIALAWSGGAHAQTTTAATPEDEQAPADIVVSSSRIDTAGFDAPTPTTVIGVAELRQAGRTDIQATLADLPQIRMTSSGNSTNTTTNSGQTPADLRGLGSSRTLVLVNGRRYVTAGDLQAVPYSLVKQIDVVTGGASAAWGSDAVAGVINIVLDDNFSGVNLGAQAGVSEQGDAQKYLFNAAFGTKITDNWHFMIGGDYLKDYGIQPAISRPRIAATGLFPSATDGRLYPTMDIRQADRAAGGLIIGGAAGGLTFNNDGTLRPFVFGRRSGSTMVGGEGDNTDFRRSLTAPLERGSVFARTSYQISDGLRIWAEGTYNKVSDKRPFFADLTISQTAYSYSVNNPYLSDATRARLQGLGISTFNMTRLATDFAMSDFEYERETWQASVGFDGNFGGGKWRYNGFYSHGEYRQDTYLTNLVKTAEFRNAIDAVRNPAGQIVCRVALTDPNSPCRPLNLFGQGNYSQDAINYIRGDWNWLNEQWLDNAGLTINGEPFEMWGKPVAVAAGIEYREQAFANSYDPVAAAGRFATINGVPIPKIGNNVKEAFAEVAIPLLANLPFVKDLTFNGAARVSDYSTANEAIWSWKLGGTWQVVDDIKFRVTRSRDIRAPSLSELYTAPGTLFQSVLDTSVNPAVPTQVVLRNGGNPNLVPETADTWVAGVVLTPRFVPGLTMSVDYYDIAIDGAITTLSGQQIVNSCHPTVPNVAPNPGACAQIVRNSAGAITDINGTFINLATYETRGLDLEVAYRTRLEGIGVPGQLSFRGLANYVDSLMVDTGILRVQGAGYASTAAAYLTPQWRVNAGVGYESERMGADLRMRWVDKAGYAPSNLTANLGDFHYKSHTYVDLSLRSYIPFGDGSRDRLTVYGSIANLFDRQPPIGAFSTPYYDIIGRYFTMGASVKF